MSAPADFTLGVWGLGLPLGSAVLLGAILAPTDPVLASDVQMADSSDRDRLRFGLTGEGGLNDGTAFPFVMLGLGYLLGALVGRAILYLRMRHHEALGSDEFIALGLIALTYGLALGSHIYSFLAVFAAGLALRRIDERSPTSDTGQDQAPAAMSPAESQPSTAEENAASSAQVPAQMMRAVERFNSQLEHFVEVGIVLTVGVMLAEVDFSSEVLWFVPVLFFVVRPLAVYLGLLGTPVKGTQRRLMAWFGIRGIGSLYYLLYAINHALEPALAERLLSLTLAVVVTSVVAHGVSVTPLMQRYEARKAARKKPVF